MESSHLTSEEFGEQLKAKVQSLLQALGSDRTGSSRRIVEERLKNTWNLSEDARAYRQAITPEFRLLFENIPEVEELAQFIEDNAPFRERLDMVVRSRNSATRVTAASVANQLLTDLVHKHGLAQFDHDHFAAVWSEINSFFESESLEEVSVWPLRGLDADHLPIPLSDDAEIGFAHDYEVDDLVGVRLLSPLGSLLDRSDAVCLRARLQFPKSGQVPPQRARAFGELSEEGDDELLEDVLLALRLAGAQRVRCPGLARFTRSAMTRSASFKQRPHIEAHPPVPSFPESDRDREEFIEIWKKLTEGVLEESRPIAAACRRYSLALERFDPEDQLVDLTIAAEALFLPASSTELKFRLAMRMAKFRANEYMFDKTFFRMTSERSVFRAVSLAYDARSQVVHNGAIPAKMAKRMIGGVSAFTERFRELMRVSLLKAIDVVLEGQRLGDDYWDSLLLDSSS